jgi:hypothetical protein
MIAVPIPFQVVAWFEAKKIFFLYLMPALIGFLVAVVYPLGSKAALNPKIAFPRVWLMAALGPALMLFGWTLTVRTIYTAPFYGLGYGLGVALLSRVHRVSVNWPPRIETRSAAAKRIRQEKAEA